MCSTLVTEKYGFTECPKFSKCWHISSHGIKRAHSLTSPLISPEIVRYSSWSNLWVSCQAEGSRYRFFVIPIFAWKVGFYHGQQILTVVSLEVTVWLCSFLRNCPTKTQVWIVRVYLWDILSSKNGVSLACSSACNSNNHTSVFPWDSYHLIIRRALFSQLCHTEYEKMCLEGWGLIELIIFPASRTHLCENGIFFKLWVWGSEEYGH